MYAIFLLKSPLIFTQISLLNYSNLPSNLLKSPVIFTQFPSAHAGTKSFFATFSIFFFPIPENSVIFAPLLPSMGKESR